MGIIQRTNRAIISTTVIKSAGMLQYWHVDHGIAGKTVEPLLIHHIQQTSSLNELTANKEGFGDPDPSNLDPIIVV